MEFTPPLNKEADAIDKLDKYKCPQSVHISYSYLIFIEEVWSSIQNIAPWYNSIGILFI